MPTNKSNRMALQNEPQFCVVCRNPITGIRLARRAVTCTPECYKRRNAIQRSHQDQAECRYCRKPSTPADRVLYARWRRFGARGEATAKLLRSLADEMPEGDKRLRQLEPLIALLATQWDVTQELPEEQPDAADAAVHDAGVSDGAAAPASADEPTEVPA